MLDILTWESLVYLRTSISYREEIPTTLLQNWLSDFGEQIEKELTAMDLTILTQKSSHTCGKKTRLNEDPILNRKMDYDNLLLYLDHKCYFLKGFREVTFREAK